jgi:hypothetical protein
VLRRGRRPSCCGGPVRADGRHRCPRPSMSLPPSTWRCRHACRASTAAGGSIRHA